VRNWNVEFLYWLMWFLCVLMCLVSNPKVVETNKYLN